MTDDPQWSIAETPKDALLSFIDAGAAGDEPVKGVMQCHIREWLDEIDRLRNDLSSAWLLHQDLLGRYNAMAGMVEAQANHTLRTRKPDRYDPI
jgi:hypothetical protein